MLVLIEKPVYARVAHAVLSANFPGESLQYLIVHPFGAPFKFDYPSNLSWNDYPFCGAARYRLDPDAQWQVRVSDGSATRSHVAYEDLEPQAVIAFPDASRSSVFASQRMLNQLLALGKVTEFHGFCLARALDPLDVQRVLDRPKSARDVAATCQEGALKADFEFAFLVNAAGILTRSYRAAGGKELNPVFSKYTVQALYALRATGPTTDGKFIANVLYMWSGTGRYAPHTTTLGGSASRHVFIDTLIELGLAERYALPEQKRGLRITQMGLYFLSRLHPDCEDPDLPFRMEEWMKDPVSGELKAQRYIRTWFGKQKRFSPKNAEA